MGASNKEIPAREAWLFKNQIAREKVLAGLKDDSLTNLSDGGDFSQFVKSESD